MLRDANVPIFLRGCVMSGLVSVIVSGLVLSLLVSLSVAWLDSLAMGILLRDTGYGSLRLINN